MATLNETPSSNRLHIGIFGKTNSGKSSFINLMTKQEVSIVADVAGTTTDPVYKPMEISPLGPCVIIDTAGFDDKTNLGEKRVEKTKLALEKTDIAVILVAVDDYLNKMENTFCEEDKWVEALHEKGTPILFVVNKCDMDKIAASQLENEINSRYSTVKKEILIVSSITGEGEAEIRSSLARLMPEDFGAEFITGDLVGEDDLVLLVMPQDIQAPKGRLILPQVQTLRELLDKKCLVVSVTTDKLTEMLALLVKAPKLIITDSQVFDYVYDNKPQESLLTSFSVLFAAYKGDLTYYVEGAKAIDMLNENSRVLIAECCTHAPLAEDIGRVKLPRMLKKRVGQQLTVDIVSGTDFPTDPSDYDLIIQCGACMFNRKYVLSRIDVAKRNSVAMTNYGVAIAHLTGILDKIAMV